MKKLLLTVLCLLAMILLTACHTDNDPWPVDGDFSTSTAIPAASTVPAHTEVQIPRTYLTPEAPNSPIPAEVPGREEAPGING